ncbi:hypothetical protein DMA11_19755 [Marinilabiliaceae bacterium JC017]|nr:hypothetical protein DMA11_19755 [Marinilabiliaceae bacterium JC017]
MSNKKNIERYGNLLKQEFLVSMDEKIMPNTFVLEAPEPFPGYFNYYSEIPIDSKPLYVYLICDRQYTLEEVTRATQNILKYFPVQFSAAAGTVTIYNDTYNVIRLRHLDAYDQVQEIQACYLDEGISFKKKPGKKISAQAILKLNKFFILEEVEEGVYFDVTEKDHGYFYIPKKLTWKYFEELTKQVKYNWDLSSFDAAIGHFHINFGIQDMIRIYNPEINIEYLLEARKKYLERIK